MAFPSSPKRLDKGHRKRLSGSRAARVETRAFVLPVDRTAMTKGFDLAPSAGEERSWGLS